MYIFTILWITIKRIAHNWRITIGMLLGLILATAVMSAIPIYSSASLQKSFLEQWIKQDSFRPPFAVIVSHNNDSRKLDVAFRQLQQLYVYLDRALHRSVGAPLTGTSVYSSLGLNSVLLSDETEHASIASGGNLVMMSNLQEISNILYGRWFEPRDDNVVEIVVDEVTFKRKELLIGLKFTYGYRIRSESRYVKISCEVVGVFQAKPGTTTEQWIYPPPYSDRAFVHPQVFETLLKKESGLRVEDYDMQWVFDYRQINVDDLHTLISDFEVIEKRVAQKVPQTVFWHSPLDFMRKFDTRRTEIERFLTTLSVPTIGMTLYYILLVAGISVAYRKKEIAVLQSRGGGRPQIGVSFFLELFILAAAAMLVGPYVGLFFARTMGASSGFLNFVERKSIPVSLSGQAFMYSLIAASSATASGMLPVLGMLRYNIVTYTRRRERTFRQTLWHRLFLDVILLALSWYGYSRLTWEIEAVGTTATIPAEPLLFFVPVLTALGAALLLLRLYPYFMGIFRLLTSKLPGVVWQLTFRHLNRNTNQYVPLMLLLATTLSMGIYSASTARTLQLNFEDRIRYEIGAHSG